MSDPSVPILKKLLSLDTPVSKRIFELALMLALVVGAGYVGEHYKDAHGIISYACMVVSVFGSLVLMLLIFVLIVTILDDAKGSLKPKK